MKSLAENHLVRFISITKKKEGTFANFKVKGLKGGMTYSTSISIDIDAADVDLTDSLEKIIEHTAKLAIKEFKKTELQFEGLQTI